MILTKLVKQSNKVPYFKLLWTGYSFDALNTWMVAF